MQELIKETLVYNTHKDLSINEVVTDTLQIAHYFDKEHKNVLRDVRKCIDDEENTFFFDEDKYLIDLLDKKDELNIEPISKDNYIKIKPSYYKDIYGREQTFYQLTRDQFTYLVMSFTGSKAVKFRIEFIKKFNQMEKDLILRIERRFDGKKERKKFIEVIQETLINAGITDVDKQNKYFRKFTAFTSKIIYGVFPSQLRKNENMNFSDETRNFLDARKLMLIAKLESELVGVIKTLSKKGFTVNEIFNEVIEYSEDFAKENDI